MKKIIKNSIDKSVQNEETILKKTSKFNKKTKNF